MVQVCASWTIFFKKALHEYKSMVAGVIPHAAPNHENVRTEAVACPHCEKSFPYHKLSSHMFSQHGIRNNVRNYISGTICVCCLKDFHTRRKIVHHISFRSPRCKAHLLKCESISSEEYCKLEEESTRNVKHLMHLGRSALYSDCRPCRVSGPLQHSLSPWYDPHKSAWKIGHRVRTGCCIHKTLFWYCDIVSILPYTKHYSTSQP